jgi:hypothetical protein
LKTRVYYQSDPFAVVLQKDGKDVISYPSVENLIETHIKAMLASQPPDSAAARDLHEKYHTKVNTKPVIDS